VADWKLYLTNM